jgi:hypothetical protein
MDDWFEDLEHDFANRQRTGVPDPLYSALRDSLGENFNPSLVHPIGEGDDVAFLVVSKAADACLIRFDANDAVRGADPQSLGPLSRAGRDGRGDRP